MKWRQRRERRRDPFNLRCDLPRDRPLSPSLFEHRANNVDTVFGQTLETEREKKQLKKSISRARALNDLRVKIAHGKQWLPYHEGGTLLHVSRRRLKEDQSAGIAAQLEKQAVLARELFWALQILLSHADVKNDDSGRRFVMTENVARLGEALAKHGAIDEDTIRLLESLKAHTEE